MMEHSDFSDTLKNALGGSDRECTMMKVWRKLEQFKMQCKDMNAFMASYEQKLKALREKHGILQTFLQTNNLDHSTIEQEKQILLEIEKWSNIEDIALRQKARAIWIDHGDANTKYFHAQWKISSSHNSISSIHTDAGIKLTDPRQIKEDFIGVSNGLMGTKATELRGVNTEVVRKGVCFLSCNRENS